MYILLPAILLLTMSGSVAHDIANNPDNNENQKHINPPFCFCKRSTSFPVLSS